MTDVTITFPDGKTKQIAAGTTGLDIAKAISPLARQAHRRHATRRRLNGS